MSEEDPKEQPRIPKDTLLNFPRPVNTYHRETYSRIDPSASSFKGDGKTVLITGGATGIGLEISRSFAAAGVSRICIISRRLETLESAKKAMGLEYPHVKVETYSASISDCTIISNVITQVGAVDIVVLAAAYAHTPAPVGQVPLESVQESYNTNVIGNWNLVKSVLDSRRDGAKQCVVINVSSFAAYATIPGQSAYGPSKAAFAQIISEFAKEYSEPQARFISYHPATVWTDMTSAHMKKEWFEGWEDVKLPGHFAVWLASPEADFLHGKFVWASWDVDELCELRGRLEGDPFFLTIGLVL